MLALTGTKLGAGGGEHARGVGAVGDVLALASLSGASAIPGLADVGPAIGAGPTRVSGRGQDASPAVARGRTLPPIRARRTRWLQTAARNASGAAVAVCVAPAGVAIARARAANAGQREVRIAATAAVGVLRAACPGAPAARAAVDEGGRAKTRATADRVVPPTRDGSRRLSETRSGVTECDRQLATSIGGVRRGRHRAVRVIPLGVRERAYLDGGVHRVGAIPVRDSFGLGVYEPIDRGVLRRGCFGLGFSGRSSRRDDPTAPTTCRRKRQQEERDGAQQLTRSRHAAKRVRSTGERGAVDSHAPKIARGHFRLRGRSGRQLRQGQEATPQPPPAASLAPPVPVPASEGAWQVSWPPPLRHSG